MAWVDLHNQLIDFCVCTNAVHDTFVETITVEVAHNRKSQVKHLFSFIRHLVSHFSRSLQQFFRRVGFFAYNAAAIIS